MVPIQNGKCTLNSRHVIVRTLTRQQLPQDDAVTVDISLFVVGLVRQNFRGHPLDSATVSSHAAILRLKATETKVTHLWRVTFVQENVCALQIAMSVKIFRIRSGEKQKSSTNEKSAALPWKRASLTIPGVCHCVNNSYPVPTHTLPS